MTYQVEILDLLTVTKYKRQNLTANFSASHSCTLVLSSGILSPCMLKTSVNTFISLHLKWKRLNGHWIISITTANLYLFFCIDLVNDSVFLIDLINACFLYILRLVWFGTDVLVSVYLSLMNCTNSNVIYLYMKCITYLLLWTATTLVLFIYTWSVLPTNFYELQLL